LQDTLAIPDALAQELGDLRLMAITITVSRVHGHLRPNIPAIATQAPNAHTMIGGTVEIEMYANLEPLNPKGSVPPRRFKNSAAPPVTAKATPTKIMFI